MTANDVGTPKAPSARPASAGDPSPQTPRDRTYQAPELHRLGSLGELRHIGMNWHDGSRYKDNLD